MQAQQIIEVLNGEIATARTKGWAQISLESLDGLVKKLEEENRANPDGHADEVRFRTNLEIWQSNVQREHESDLEMLRSTIALGQMALKSALLINGGGAVAFLAFLGPAWAGLSSLSAKAVLASAMAWFVWGVLLTAGGTVAAYLSQAGFGGEFGRHSEAIGEVARVVAVLAVTGSFVMFALGCFAAVGAFEAGL